MTSLAAEPLSAGAFAQFGRLVERPIRRPDATGPGWQWWAETALLPADARSFGIGYLDLRPHAPRFDWAERHMRSVEVVVPLDGDCLAYVGPPEDLEHPERIPSRHRFRVFRIPVGSGIAMEPGVWHGAPLAIDAPVRAIVLLLEGTGANDTVLVQFPDDAVEIGGVS